MFLGRVRFVLSGVSVLMGVDVGQRDFSKTVYRMIIRIISPRAKNES